jgi:DNA-binding winged helix-turn-helix (wHTH) protein
MTEHKFCVFTFADVEVREREYCLVKDGEVLPVEPKAFRVLLFLLHHPHKLISKDELLDAVWNDASVSENSLTRSVALLRRVLRDDTREPRYIATVPTVGYRFLHDVQVAEDGFAPLSLSTQNGHAVESAVATEKQKPENQPSDGSRRKSKTLIVAGVSVAALIVLTAGLLIYRAMNSRATLLAGSSLAGTTSSKMRIVATHQPSWRRFRTNLLAGRQASSIFLGRGDGKVRTICATGRW